MRPLPEGWEREDAAEDWTRFRHGDLGEVWSRATGVDVIVSAVEDLDLAQVLGLRDVLAAAAARHLELRGVVPAGGGA